MRHECPDPDAIGSQVGLRNYHFNITLGEMPSSLKVILEKMNVITQGTIRCA